MTFGCLSSESKAASRKKEVGIPSSRPAFVSSKSTMRSMTMSPEPKARHLKIRPLERLSTTLSNTTWQSTSLRCCRARAHSSLPCATSLHCRQTGAALETMSRAPNLLKTSSHKLNLPERISGSLAGEIHTSSLANFNGDSSARPWLCFRRFVGESAMQLKLNRCCKGLRWLMGVCRPGLMFSSSSPKLGLMFSTPWKSSKLLLGFKAIDLQLLHFSRLLPKAPTGMNATTLN
mmetsp:Transcript_75024/g.123855  ORF Transcript_75024/g.123855 Transcript_75024/m.123855 type:complete len:233 (-) Transcript_75024:3-701(-)